MNKFVKFFHNSKKFSRWLTGFRSFANVESLFQGVPQGKVFGKKLENVEDIPKFLGQMMDYIQKNSHHEGVFRKNGKKDVIDEIREVIDMGDEFPMKDMHDHVKGDIHTICGLFKLYFRMMPECLLHFELYDDWIESFKIKKEKLRARKMKKLLTKLSPAHFALCKDLFYFLSEVGKNKDKSKMGPENLSLVFAPNVLRPKEFNIHSFSDAGTICQVVQILIESPKEFFEKK